MAYSAEISRTNPTCFLFLIDQSGSMGDPVPNQPNRKKADAVADAMNQLQNLVIRCAPKKRVSAIIFTSELLDTGVPSALPFSGALAGKELVSISEVGNLPARIEDRTKKVDDGAGGITDQSIRLPIWFDSVAGGGTPMCQALGLAQGIIQRWLTQHPFGFPPVVMQITDGESTDGDPTSAMSGIKGLASQDGNVLMFNIHISSDPNANPIAFPDSPQPIA